MLRLFICFGMAFLLFSFINYACKKKKPFKRAFLSILCGVLVLVLVDALAGVSGVYIPVTAFTLSVAAIGGIPGVAGLVLLMLF